MSILRPRVLAIFALTAALVLPACSDRPSAGSTGGAAGSAESKPAGPPFEVVLLDDQPDPFATLAPPVPAGIAQFQEVAVLSPEDIQARTYVRLVVQPGEALPQAMARAKPWFDKQPLPPGDRLVFGEIVEENEVTKQREAVGVRTYVATSQVILTQADVADASVGAMPDQEGKPQPVANVQLTPPATERFRKFTRENTLRRIGILVSGYVVMSARIQEEITEGKLSLTLDPEMPYEPKRAELQRIASAIKPKPAVSTK
jgi:hypothetical protein